MLNNEELKLWITNPENPFTINDLTMQIDVIDILFSNDVTKETYNEWFLHSIQTYIDAEAQFEIQDYISDRACLGDTHLDLDLARKSSELDIQTIFMNEIYFHFMVDLVFHWKISSELSRIVKQTDYDSTVSKARTIDLQRGRYVSDHQDGAAVYMPGEADSVFDDALRVYGPICVASVVYMIRDVLKLDLLFDGGHFDSEYFADGKSSVWHRMMDPKYLHLYTKNMKRYIGMKAFLCIFPCFIPDLAAIVYDYFQWYADDTVTTS